MFSLGSQELFGFIIGCLFTIALMSYIIKDNPLFRIALHILIGVTAGYISLVTIYEVLQPRFSNAIQIREPLVLAITIVPIILFLLLAFKLNSKTTNLGNITVGFLAGVGIGTAVGSAVSGTLIPQIGATILSLAPASNGQAINNLILIIGTVTALLYFQTTIRIKNQQKSTEVRKGLRALSDTIGKAFISMALGVVLGGVVMTGTAIFSERIIYLIDAARQIFGK